MEQSYIDYNLSTAGAATVWMKLEIIMWDMKLKGSTRILSYTSLNNASDGPTLVKWDDNR